MKYTFLTYLFISISISLPAQVNLDSLWGIWNDKANADTSRLNALDDFIYYGYLKTGNDSAAYYANMMIVYAEERGFQEYIADGYYNLAGANKNNGELNKANNNYQKALEIYEELGDEKRIVRPLIVIIQLDLDQRNFYASEVNARKALKIYQKIGDKDGIAKVLWKLARIHVATQQYALGIEEYSESLVLYRELNDTVSISGILNNIGSIYKVQGNNSNALEYYEEANEIIKKAGSLNHVALRNIITIHIYNGDYAKAMNSLNEIQKQVDNGNAGDYYDSSISKRSLDTKFGDVYSAQGNYPLALDYYKSAWVSAKKDSVYSSKYEERIGFLYLKMNKKDLAIEWCARAFEGAVSAEGYRDACECLYKSYKSIDNHAQALKYSELYQSYKDSLNLEEATESLLEMEFTNKVIADSLLQEEDKLRIELVHQSELRKKKRNQNVFLVSGLIILLIAIGLWNRMRFTRKANARLKIERDRAEHSELVKHQFLANMSHEIRTPMNAIKGMIDILLRRRPKKDQRSYLESIKEASNSLLVIINDILDLSKIESGKVELENIPFSIPEMLQNVYTIMQFKAEEKGLELKLDIPTTIPGVIGDPMRIRQVLINLLGNAIKFTEKGIVNTKIVIEEDSNKAIVNAHFTVSDTGIGIDADKLDQVFNSFEQAYADTSRKFGGTGLGLSISKKLIELHDGKIWVESKRNIGSQFHFTIPFSLSDDIEYIEKEPDTLDIESIRNQMKGLKVLLVEDNAFNVIVAQEELEDAIEKVSVSVAENGAIAVELARNDDFDIVLMDVQMPVMNGYEATKAIRNLGGEKAEIPIIAMTANVLKEEVALCYEAGMNDFIGKPFEIEILIQKIYSLTKNQENPVKNS